MKVALVHDDLIQFGGAEKVLLALHELFPEAPIFTSVVSPEWKKVLEKQNISYQTSFVQNLPKVFQWYRQYALTLSYCLAFEGFNFNAFDVVISSSSRFSHGIVTRPETLHICYMHSPGRMLWEPTGYFESELVRKGAIRRFAFLLSQFPLSYMRLWNRTAAQRVDNFVANSEVVKGKIKRFYNRDSVVIHPFCDVRYFSEGNTEEAKEPYFLILSRLSAWKKIDIAIQACNELNVRLLIAGEGPDKKRLEKMAGGNVRFLGYVTEEEKKKLLKNCLALIFPQSEDFGITPLEAMASGRPVIAYKDGGALETLTEGKTGEFFYPQTKEALSVVISKFDPRKYLKDDCISRALQFDKSVFLSSLKAIVESTYVPKS